MTNTQKFIEDAIAGGWDINGLKYQMNFNYDFRKTPFGHTDLWCMDDCGGEFWLDHDKMLLSPKAWQAVGKTRGWGKKNVVMVYGVTGRDTWLVHKHWFVDHLADGLSIEDALGKIS